MIVVDVRDMPPEQWRLGVETRMLVSAGNGAAQLCIFEQWIAPGAGAPTHSHPVEEVLTVRDGEAEMWMDEQRVTVSAGQSLIVPAERMHGFRNSGNVTLTSTRCWRRRFSKPRWKAPRKPCGAGRRCECRHPEVRDLASRVVNSLLTSSPSLPPPSHTPSATARPHPARPACVASRRDGSRAARP